MEGVVVTSFRKRGFGFIRPIESHSKDDNVFAHFKHVHRHSQHKVTERFLLVGEKVHYQLARSKPRPEAVNVRVESTRQSVRATIVSCRGSHISARFPWEHDFRSASVNKSDIEGCENRIAAHLKPGDEIVGIAYTTVDERVKLGFCVIPPNGL